MKGSECGTRNCARCSQPGVWMDQTRARALGFLNVNLGERVVGNICVGLFTIEIQSRTQIILAPMLFIFCTWATAPRDW